MYFQKPIPSLFQKTYGKPQSVSDEPSVIPIKAAEKTREPSASRQHSISPLEALLFLNVFSLQKKDGSAGSA